MQEGKPYVVASEFGGNVAEWYEITDAYQGESAIRVTAGDIRFNTTDNGAIRIPIENSTGSNLLFVRIIRLPHGSDSGY